MYGRQTGPCVYVTPYNARSLRAVAASTEHHRFMVGTCDVNPCNQIQVLEYSEDKNRLEALVSYSHAEQVIDIESSPKDQSLVITSGATAGGTYSLNLWKLPLIGTLESPDTSEVYSPDMQELELMSQMEADSPPSSLVSCVKWNRKKDVVLTMGSSILKLWSIGAETQVASQLDLSKLKQGVPLSWTQAKLCWDPLSANSAAFVSGSDLCIMDTHNMRVINSRVDAHKYGIRDVDYNPNKPQTVITAGHDRSVRVWDLRNLSTSLSTLCGHTHWVTCVKYNPFHDQLILSGGSDSSVNLWRVASCSSSPWVSASPREEDVSIDPPDIKVKHIDQHEDAVYSVAWSAVDAWSYASLSFDGRVIVNQVPTTEKYKILL